MIMLKWSPIIMKNKLKIEFSTNSYFYVWEKKVGEMDIKQLKWILNENEKSMKQKQQIKKYIVINEFVGHLKYFRK